MRLKKLTHFDQVYERVITTMSRLTDKSISQHYAELFEQLKLKIASEPDDYIIAQRTEDLIKYYLGQSLKPIEFDPDREETLEHKKYIKNIPAREREWDYQSDGDLTMECEKVIVRLPILPNANISQILALRTHVISLSGDPRFTIERNEVIIELEIKGYGLNLTNEEISQTFVSKRAKIENHIISKNNEINSENSKLKDNLTQFINQRKEKLDQDKKRIGELVKLIKVPLARKGDKIAKKIQLDTKPFVKRLKPKTLEEDYELDREKVIDIINLINNQCFQFERTPKTYETFGESNLRDLILANLNSIFEGKATGETFSNKGKTDIYLIIDKGNILVSECKIYAGEKLYHQTMDQLLGYLTWRHNYAIMISFCKQKNFTKIVAEAESIIKRHTSYESDFGRLTKTHFVSKNTLPSDEYKYVEFHHLYYNLYLSENINNL
jgi:hypothetical protein